MSHRLPEDLREMDERQFAEAFEMFRDRTKGFTRFSSELLRKAPQFLFVSRIGLGLSQLEFSRKLGVDKQWVRHFESGRQGFRQSEVIPKLIDFLTKEFSSPVDLQRSLEKLRITQLARERSFMKPPITTIRLKRVFEMEPDDFQKAFLLLKEKTRGFTDFERGILVDTPQFISVLRIILDMGILEFSRVLGIDDSHIRRWESMRDWITPSSAEMLMSKIQQLFKERGLTDKVELDSAMKSFGKFCFFDRTELKIKGLLEKEEMSFDVHKELICGKKKIITDFLVHGIKSSELVLEVTKLSKRRRKDLTTRVVVLDHRFHVLKIFHPDFKTAMFLDCDSSQIGMVKRIVEREVVSTDIVVIKSFDELMEKIEQHIY